MRPRDATFAQTTVCDTRKKSGIKRQIREGMNQDRQFHEDLGVWVRCPINVSLTPNSISHFGAVCLSLILVVIGVQLMLRAMHRTGTCVQCVHAYVTQRCNDFWRSSPGLVSVSVDTPARHSHRRYSKQRKGERDSGMIVKTQVPNLGKLGTENERITIDQNRTNFIQSIFGSFS